MILERLLLLILLLVHYCQKWHLGLTPSLIGSPFRRVKPSSQLWVIHLFAWAMMRVRWFAVVLLYVFVEVVPFVDVVVDVAAAAEAGVMVGM